MSTKRELPPMEFINDESEAIWRALRAKAETEGELPLLILDFAEFFARWLQPRIKKQRGTLTQNMFYAAVETDDNTFDISGAFAGFSFDLLERHWVYGKELAKLRPSPKI